MRRTVKVQVEVSLRNNFVLLATSGSQPGAVVLGLRATTKARFFVLEKSGHTLTVVVLTDAPTDFDAVVAASQPVLDSIALD
jgi:hypothetical protein